MPSIANEQVVDGAVIGNIKMLTDMAQVTMGQTIQDAARQQSRQQDLAASVLANAMNGAQQLANAAGNLTLALTARTAHTILNSAEQAAAFDKTLAANLEGKMANLEAALSSGQQMSKIANTTPPQTGTGGAFGSETGLSQQVALALSNLAAGQAAIVELLRGRGGA